MRYWGVAFVSAGVLLLELTLTRIYSITQGYHFAFLAVSLGLLGFGASGSVLFAWPRLLRRSGNRLLPASALLFGLTTIGAHWAANWIPFDSYRLVIEPRMLWYMAVFYAVQVAPFLFGGLVLGGAISTSPGRAGGVYGAALAGSSVGALLALGGPASAGPGAAIGLTVTLAALGWLALATSGDLRRRLVVALAALVLISAGWTVPGRIALKVSPYKPLPQLLGQEGSVLTTTRWNSFSRVDVVDSPALHQSPGLSFQFEGRLPAQRAITLDADSPTMMTRTGAEGMAFTDFLPSAAAYRLVERPRVLVVDPGGGLDVEAAVFHGASRVLALSGNPIEAGLLTDHFSPGAHRLGAAVEVVSESPRSYLHRSDDEFDLVIVSLRDSFRPITAGAYSLSESYQYTLEAFEKYLGALAPGGVFAASRWTQTPPSEELRAATTLIEAMERAGFESPERSLAAIRTLQTLTLIVKRGGLSDADNAAVRAFATERRFDLAYLPGLDAEQANRFFVLPVDVYYPAIAQALDPASREDLYQSSAFNLVPATDDRPFFFHFFRWGQAPEILSGLGRAWEPFGGAGFLVLLAFLGIAVVVSGLMIIGPLFLRRDRSASSAPSLEPSPLAMRAIAAGYFGLLGMAFLWIELPLMQRFILLLDFPLYSFGVVLFGILVFSGLGSALSSRFGARRTWAVAAAALLGAVYAWGALPPAGMVLGLPLGLRLLIVIASMAPLAVPMGMALPAGIAALEQRAPELIPWAWGVNGFASVIGSALAALLTLTLGFTQVMLLASGAYALAWALLHFALRPTARTERSELLPG